MSVGGFVEPLLKLIVLLFVGAVYTLHAITLVCIMLIVAAPALIMSGWVKTGIAALLVGTTVLGLLFYAARRQDKIDHGR